MRTMISSVIIVIAAVIDFLWGRNESGYGWRNAVCDNRRFCLYNPGY